MPGARIQLDFAVQGQKNEPRQYGGGTNPPSPATWVNNQIRRWKQAEEHPYKPVYVDEPVRPPTAPTQGHSARVRHCSVSVSLRVVQLVCTCRQPIRGCSKLMPPCAQRKACAQRKTAS